MERRFLHKNVVVIAMVLGAVLLAFAFYTLFISNDETADPALAINEESIKNIVSDTVSFDTDNDGLKDWEEVLLKTDPKNPDSDGDGTNDGDEVNQNRNPLVVGPDDSIGETSEGKLAIASEPIIESKTVTEDFAVELFSGYLELKNAGTLTTYTGDQLIDEVVNKAVKDTVTQTYTLKDLSVVKEPSIETISTYDTEFTHILRPDPSAENDVVVLKRIVETENIEELSILDTSIKRYEKIVSEMLLLTVPEPIAKEHINATNALAAVTENIRGMRTVFVDPLRALINVKEYTENESVFIQNMIVIGEYLEPYRTANN